jgi:glycosyltransferase involved in cell wall biosynthesis/peptidoglycan hydrolase CwlO-like protein
MKAILVATELFDVGGLETHVSGEVACLSQAGYHVHLVAGSNANNLLLPKAAASVTSGLAFGPDTTVSGLVQTVEMLRQLIRKQAIECVHAHPFTSLLPCLIAAEMEEVPFVITLHGPASLTDCYGPIYDFLLTSIVLPKADMVVAVSKEVANLVAPYVPDSKVWVLPNGVPLDVFGGTSSSNWIDPRWLLVSRLDSQKIVGVRDFVRKAAHAGIPGVLLAGDGHARALLAEQLAEDGLSGFVEFLGMTAEIPSLMKTVVGVAGMGRVVLEGLASKNPVILVGYDGVKGRVDSRNFERAAEANFSGRNLPNIDEAEFARQINPSDDIDASEIDRWIHLEFSDAAIWCRFIDRINNLTPHDNSLFTDLYRVLRSQLPTDNEPYLQSSVLLDQIGRLVRSTKHFEPRMVATYNHTREQFMETKLAQAMWEHERRITELRHINSNLERQLSAKSQTMAERDGRIASLNQEVAARDNQIASLNQEVAARDGQIASLNHEVAARDGQIASLNQEVAARDGQIASLNQEVAARDGQIASLNQEVAARDNQIASLNQEVAARDGQIASLNQEVAASDGQIASLNQLVTELECARSQILHSNSWRITKPLRFLFRIVRYGLGDQDKAQVRLLLRNQYRRLPLTFKLKNTLRTAFFRITGWSSHTPPPLAQLQSASNLASGIQTSTAVQSPARHMTQSGTLAISCEAPHQIKPYFGVRRPHGKRRAAILTNQLLDWHDGRPRFGGGERYALEFARLLRELSIEVTFFQPSLRSGSGNYYSFEVKLLPLADSVGEFHYGVCSSFTELTADFDHVYYHLPEYASGTVREDGLMTCHGIWFDHDNYPDSIFRTPPWFEQLYRAFRNPIGVVSVDTNSIGVIRSLWPEIAQKMRFIPNFYDASSYHPDSTNRNPQRLTILFPRRSQINRGSRIFGDIVDRIPHDVDIIWLGEGDPVDTQIVKDVCARDKRASFHVADFDQMPAWYQKADIAVIPTLACEGTSLSCIEALACGCAVIATNVGGLPDVVYDGINGLLVEPEASSLANAINRLIEDKALRERLQRSGAETARNFELQMWRARWVELLRGFGWISDDTCSAWFAEKHSAALVTHPTKAEKWVILTRNAIHGGVESLVREEARLLDAPVIVCGGHDRKDTCPFEYSRADDARALVKAIADYDVILYHWLPDWALQVIRKSHKSSIEFVHRTDTSESDKTVPTALVTHSAFLAKFIHETYGKLCRVVDHPIALDQFVPQPELGPCVGAITSYYETKGIDTLLRAWALLKDEFPTVPLRFYGAGEDLHRFVKLADELGIDAEFRDATREPWRAMQEFRCFVVPSRIEGLPVAILEALAMNIPVVASALPGMLEFNDQAIRRGYEGYVDLANPDDPEDLARVIRAVLKNSARKDSNLYIRDYYSPQKHCSDLVSVLREIRRH